MEEWTGSGRVYVSEGFRAGDPRGRGQIHSSLLGCPQGVTGPGKWVSTGTTTAGVVVARGVEVTTGAPRGTSYLLLLRVPVPWGRHSRVGVHPVGPVPGPSPTVTGGEAPGPGHPFRRPSARGVVGGRGQRRSKGTDRNHETFVLLIVKGTTRECRCR